VTISRIPSWLTSLSLSLLRYSLGTRSVISALDLCAAAVWRLSDGQPLSGGKEQDLDGAFSNGRSHAWSAAGLAREG
jgi:hypothetical protein